MVWVVNFTKRAAKQTVKLPIGVKSAMYLLVEDLKYNGPSPGKQWHNYGILHSKKREDKRHCHLLKGKPTYICCWQVVDKRCRTLEVYYVGTHEKAPY